MRTLLAVSRVMGLVAGFLALVTFGVALFVMFLQGGEHISEQRAIPVILAMMLLIVSLSLLGRRQ